MDFEGSGRILERFWRISMDFDGFLGIFRIYNKDSLGFFEISRDFEGSGRILRDF